MRIVTWNVNSLKARQEFVAETLDRAPPDILAIQELKLEDDKVPREMFESRGYHVAVHGQRQWNGVLLASRWPIESVERGLPGWDEGQARLIAGHTAGLHLVNLYCPQGQSVDSPQFPFKLGFYRGLQAWLQVRMATGGDWVVLGDLNVAPDPDDVWDPQAFQDVPSFHPKEHEAFRALLALGLHDAVKPRLAPHSYSFWDYRAGAFPKNFGMRIDHVLVSTGLLPRVQSAWIDRQERKKKGELSPSDHAPVGIELV